ncbi:MAG: tetraacyldisaccharide 4'-kinase [Planctomycetaceae bacterium]|jgi:tetraacyldisaccharide 4'-kinase|nr:tetraacyldisaccharide 4'-kinase [Planctomycetaceae bacterium]
MWEDWFRQLVSGERHGARASLLRGFLSGLAIVYGMIVQIRNLLYDKKILKVHKTNIPVISVGNITLGGTGKSPLVARLCEYLISRNLNPAIISSGYKHNKAEKSNDNPNVNDEYLELALRLPDVYHCQNRNRVVAIEELLCFAVGRGVSIDVVILDDGMQHRRLHRDLEIVLLDAMLPFGYGYLFPRGLLRESVEGLRRADVILLSRADCVADAVRAEIAGKIREIAPNAIYAEVSHTPEKIIYYGKGEADVMSIQDKNIFAFCGIGNPNAFLQTLRSISSGQIHLEQYPDHYGYTKEDVIEIAQKANLMKVDVVICTMKDFVKVKQILDADVGGGVVGLFVKVKVAALVIRIKFLANESQFDEAVKKIF